MIVYGVCIVLFLLYLLRDKKIKRLKKFTAGIPGPKVYPFIGNGLVMTTYKDGKCA